MAVSNRDAIVYNLKRKSSAEAPVVQAPQRSTTSSWHVSSQPTEAETVAQIYRVAQQDRKRGEQAYSLYQKAKAEGAWNDPYSKPTTKYGELVGIDPITLNDDNIRSLAPYLQKGVQTASGGLSSAKGNGSEAVNAYNLSNLMQDYENTKAYLAEQDEIVKEAQYWIRKGLSDDEIKAKLNIGGEGTKYTKIKNAIDKAAVGEVVRTTSPLWAATSYGVDSMLWGLRNPGQSTGDKFMDAVQMELGRGNAYVRDEAKMSRLDATSDSYNPYMVGTTMDDLAIKYGVDRFDKAWIDQNRALLNNPETAGDYSKIYAAIENTDLLQAEAERFKGELARYVERGEFPDYDKLLREGTIYGDSFDNLVKLDESLKSGKLIATTDAIDFDLNTLKAETDRAVQLKQNQLKAASDLEAANKLAEEEKKNWFSQAAEAISEGLATIGGWFTTPKETVEPPKALADETPEEAIAEGATMFSPQVSALAQNGDPGAAAEVANAELAGILEQNPELLTTDNTQKAAIFMMALAGEAGILTDPEQQEKAKVYQDAVTTSMSVDMNSEESKNFLGWLDDVLQTGGTLVAAQENEGVGAQMTAMLLVDRFMARGADAVENIVGAGIAGLGELLNNEWLIDYGKRTMERNDQAVAHYDAVVAGNGTPLEILAVQQGSEIAHMMQMGSLSKAVSAYNAIKTGGAVNFMTRALMGTPFALESGGSTLQETYAETGNYTTAVAAGLTATALTTLLSQWDGILKNIEANGMPYLSEVVEKLGSVPGSGAKACVARWGKGAGMWLMNGLKTIVNESAQEAVEGGATDILVGLIKGENLSEMDWEKFGKDRLTDAVGSVFLSLVSAVSTMPTYARSVKVAESQMRKSDMTAQDMKTFVEAVKEDLQDPAIVAEMDKRAEAIAVETRTGELIAEGAMGDKVERAQQIGWLSQVANNILYMDIYHAPEKLGANAELSSKISDEFRPLVDALDTASLELESAEKEYAAAAQARNAAYQAFRNEPHNPDLKRKADEALAERKRLNEKVRDAKTKVEAAVEAVQSKQRDIQTAAATKLEEIRGQAKTEVQQRVQEIRQFNYSDVDTEANVATVSQMESVADLTGDEFAIGGKTLVQDVTNYYEQEYGGMAQNPVLGDVLLTRRGAKDSLAHGITPQKAIAYAAVPEVVKNGQIIDIERNWKKKQIDTFAIAAPIRIMSGDNAGEYYMAVVVQRSQDNQRFYVHDVLLQENKTEGPDATFKPEGVTEPLPAAEEVTSGVTKDPTLQSLLEKVRDVKKGNASRGVSLPRENGIPDSGSDYASEGRVGNGGNLEGTGDQYSVNTSGILTRRSPKTQLAPAPNGMIPGGSEQEQQPHGDGERQFVVQTLPNNPNIPEWAVEGLLNNPNARYYEKDTNRDQLVRGWQRVQENGVQSEVERLLSLDTFTADDTAESTLLMAMALREDTADPATFFALAEKSAVVRTGTAQAMQAQKLISKMTPDGIKIWAAGQLEQGLREHMRTHQPQRQQVDEVAAQVADQIRDLQSGESNNRWGIPINEQQQALIDHYKLNKVARPGIFYNRATMEQRMLEAIIATPNPLEVTGLGLNLIQRLEFMKRGEAVITNADLNYMGTQLGQFVALGGEGGGRAADLALARAYEAFGNITPATRMEKFRTMRYVNMLFTFTSFSRNLIGNVGQNVVNAAAHGIGVEIDRLASLKSGKRTMAHLSTAERIEGWKAFAEETKNTFLDFFVDKVNTAPNRDKYSTNQRGRTFQSSGLEIAKDIESFLMSVGDRNVWKKAFVNSMAEQQKLLDRGLLFNDDGTTRTQEQMVEQAEADANYATFTEESLAQDVMNYLRSRNPVAADVISLYMPFTGVPHNIMKRNFQYSPFGFLTMAGRMAANKVQGRRFDQHAFVNDLSRALTGTGGVLAGVMLGLGGIIKMGTEDEEKDKVYDVETALGEQYTPYVYDPTTDTYVSMSTFAPSASPLVWGASIGQMLQNDEFNASALISAMTSSIDSIFDASYLSGLSDLFGGYGSFAENLAHVTAENLSSQLTPAFLNQIANAMDPYVRETKDKNYMVELLKTTMNRIPGLRNMLPEKVTVAGENVMTKQGWSLVDPFTRTNPSDNAALLEVKRLYDVTGRTGVLPSDALRGRKNEIKIDKKSVVLNDQQKEEYKKYYGQLWTSAVNDLTSTPAYQLMDDDERADRVESIMNASPKQAKKEFIERYGK